MDNLSIDEMLEELESAATLEGSEVGEQWQALVNCRAAADYGSKEFREAYEKEVQKQYTHLKENFRIVERRETREVTYTDLKFIG